MNDITLNPSDPSPDEGITLNPTDVTPPVSESVATSRATKAYAGLKDKVDKSYDAYRNSIISGQEDSLRGEISDKINAQRAARRQQMIVETANSKGGALEPQDIIDIDEAIRRNDVFEGTQDPRSVFEEHYAKQYADAIHWPLALKNQDELHWWKQAVQEVPEVVQQEQQTTQKNIALREYFLKRSQDLQAEREQQSFLGKTGEFLESSIPFYSEYMLRGNIPYEGTAITRAGALEAQRLALHNMPYEQAKDSFDTAVDNLKQYNLDEAISFANAMLGQSTSETIMHGLGQVGDISTAPIGKITTSLARKAVLAANVKSAFKTVERSLAATEVKPVEVAAANGAGDLTRASEATEAANVVDRFMGQDNPALESKNAMGQIFDEDASKKAAGPGNFGQEKTNRLVESGIGLKDRLFGLLETIAKVERVPALLGARLAVAAELKRIEGEYTGLRNSIISITQPYKNELLNTWYSDIILGQYNADFFVSENQAKIFAQQNRLVGFVPDNANAGNGWYLRYQVPIKENSWQLRNEILTAPGTTTPDSFLKVFSHAIGWLRTSDETLSAENTFNRKIAIYGQAKLKALYKEEADSIRELAKGRFGRTERTRTGNIVTPWGRRSRYNEWVSVLEAQRDMPSLQDPTKKGRFFDSPADLEHYYQANFGRLPDDLEVKAYYSFVNMTRIDWAIRNIDTYKLMSRVGTMDYAISALKSAAGARMRSAWIPAVKGLTVPGGDETILVMGKIHGQEKVYSGNMSAKLRLELQKDIDQGKKQIIRLWSPGYFPLSTWGGKIKASDRIEYVISDKFHNKQLGFNQLPVRDGGHIEYDYNHYIKQAKINPQLVSGKGSTAKYLHWYEGDTTVMPVQLRALGEDAVKILNEAREHLRAGNHAYAATALSRLPITYKEFRGWFNKSKFVHPTTGETIEVPARLSKDEPFVLVPKDNMIVDLNKDLEQRYINPNTGKSTFRDGTKEGSLMNQYRVAFTGERDVYEMNALSNKGTRHRPLYAYDAATKVNPITTLNRGLNRIVNSFYMDDYKIMAVEHWLQEAKDFLTPSTEQIRSAPFYYFHRAQDFWKKTKDADSVLTIRKLETAQKQIKLFMGEPSRLDSWLNATLTKLEDSIYGGNVLTRPGLKFMHWSLATAPSVASFLRGATFHAVIGMFNWVQSIVQSLTFSTILGIAGPNAAYHGWLGANLHQMGRLSGTLYGDVGKALDKIASKMGGFKPGEWLEARELLSRTGFDFVGGEHVLLDHTMTPKIWRSAAGDFLNAGEVFFKGGERYARYGAWFAAYKEFRRLNPTGKITNHDLLGILNRADLLSGNMTAASKSALQRGPIAPFTTQFLGYQLRLLEQLTGKRLTHWERARMVAVQAAFYGVPASTGLAGLPFGDSIRQYAIEHGYVVGEHFYTDIIMNGLPAYMMAFINGGGDPQAGIQYNVGGRYGNPGGFDFIRNAVMQDRNVWRIVFETLGGAAGSTIMDSWIRLDPLFSSIASLIRDGGESHPYTFDDVLEGARTISSINNGLKGLVAINSHIWQSRRETPIETLTSSQDAIWRAISGLTSQEAEDTNAIRSSQNDQNTAYKIAHSEFNIEFRRYLNAIVDDNFSAADKYWARAKGVLDAANVPIQMRSSWTFTAANSNQETIAKLNYDYYVGKNVPNDQAQERLKTFETIQAIREKKGK